MDNIVEMCGICKSFYGVKVLKNVNFSVHKGEIHAVCGENGAGKSTLMKILAGIYKKDEGEIYFKGEQIKRLSVIDMKNLGISMIFQEINLIEDLTVAQNLFLNREKLSVFGTIDEAEMTKRAKDILHNIEDVCPNKKAKELGIAQQQIVEIAKAISFNAELIIMDEPTAVLTLREVKILFKLMRKLRQAGITIIYISHRLKEIKEICDRVTILKDGEYVCTKDCSNVSERDIAKLMVGRDLEAVIPKKFNYEAAQEILNVQHLSYHHCVQNVSFTLHKGEVLGFYGLVGAGRTEMAELIFGIRKPDSGTVEINGQPAAIRSPLNAIQNKLAFATEDRKRNGLFLGRNIRENTMVIKNLVNRGIWLDKVYENETTEKMRNQFKIKYASPLMEVKNLSGGNQQKIVLSKWILSDAEIIILDEPTRGVDIGARKEIYDFISSLSEQGKSIIIISSDIPELLETSHRVIVMHLGEVTGDLPSDDATEEKLIICATGIEKGVVTAC